MEHPYEGFKLERSLSRRFPIYLIRSESPEALEILKANRLTALAQHNHRVQLRNTVPDDASYTQQWSLNNTGQNGGVAGADIDAELAWDITTGGLTAAGDTIVVAVIDGGFQMNHPDLVMNYYVNRSEIPGNGQDDDGNGYVDDVSGWDAYADDGTIPSDQHGTHVSGIIGAKGNNGIGVSGVNWDAKILPIFNDLNFKAANPIRLKAEEKLKTAVDVIENLYNHEPELRDAMIVRTLLFMAVADAKKSPEENLAAFHDDSIRI